MAGLVQPEVRAEQQRDGEPTDCEVVCVARRNASLKGARAVRDEVQQILDARETRASQVGHGLRALEAELTPLL